MHNYHDFFVFTMITKTRTWRHILYHGIGIPRPKNHDIEIPRPKNRNIKISGQKHHDIEKRRQISYNIVILSNFLEDKQSGHRDSKTKKPQHRDSKTKAKTKATTSSSCGILTLIPRDRKRYDIWFRENMIYIDIGCKSAAQQTNKWRKDTKDEEVTLI